MILKHFDILTEQGLKVIPLRKSSKIPICLGWTSWNRDQCREVLSRVQGNIGVLLGNLVDVEGDTSSANEKIRDLIGDYRHPSYTSSKSVHHLFQNPEPSLTILKHNGIEFRAHRHQSVLPPSVIDGIQYRWLDTVSFPVPAMPERLLSFFHSLLRKKPSLKPGHRRLHCALCSTICYIHKKRFALELIAFQALGQRWQCHHCREVDLRPICRQIRKYSSKSTNLYR